VRKAADPQKGGTMRAIDIHNHLKSVGTCVDRGNICDSIKTGDLEEVQR